MSIGSSCPSANKWLALIRNGQERSYKVSSQSKHSFNFISKILHAFAGVVKTNAKKTVVRLSFKRIKYLLFQSQATARDDVSHR